ncbi:MAG: hypothetical protein KBA31_02450 [Alphaproteobacteria bacterium]|nr:hypothetical protein [Alphaproteobacteria bacterium]
MSGDSDPSTGASSTSDAADDLPSMFASELGRPFHDSHAQPLPSDTTTLETPRTSPPTTAEATTASPETPAIFKRQVELDAADYFVKQTQFGKVGEKITPFTTQLKREARRFFPIDDDVYAITDGLQREIRERYVNMRFWTLSFYLLFCIWTFLLVAGQRDALDFVGRLAQLPVSSALALLIAVGGILLVLLRSFTRWWVTKDLRQATERLSFKVKERYQEILHECRIASSEIVHMAGEGKWPERAAKCTKVALWYAIRADYLDRYSTTTLWKVDTSFRNDERCFWAGKVLLATVLGWLIAGMPNAGLAFATFALVAVIGWRVAGARSNNIFSVTFNEVYAGEGARSHYFEALAKEIENLVELTERNMWNRST